MDRWPKGLVLDRPGKIAWNYSTGAFAINLAILFGAHRIVLLGYDMKLDENGENNWHPNKLDNSNPCVFKKFVNGFEMLKKEMKLQCPHVQVLNAGPDSLLETFPKIDLETVL